MPSFKPMLAADCKGDTSLLRFPLLASPKLDGVRCIIRGGEALSRSLKPIPNLFIQDWVFYNGLNLEGLDGELIVGSPTQSDRTSDTEVTAETVMSRTMSGVMRKDGRPDFTFWVFDSTEYEGPFFMRLASIPLGLPLRCKIVEHDYVENEAHLRSYEQICLTEGYEGIMTRSPDGLYKQGRSTMKEQGLVKVKRFSTYEAEVIGVEELMHNENEKVGEGIQKRGTSAAGLVPAGVLGALVCLRPDGVEFNIGTGFTAEQRRDLWSEHFTGGTLYGLTVTYRCFDYGSKDAPRFPVFVSFRSKEDVS